MSAQGDVRSSADDSSGRDVEFQLAGGPYAGTAARLALGDLDERLDPVMAQDLRLLVTEAVKNSVEHAGVGEDDSIGLKLSVDPARVRVEVCDDGPGFEPDPSHPGEETSGWGLFLIDQMSDRWGVVRENALTRVWFELDRPPSSA
ncbi:MAG: ATP-binding protein [Thermoleophilaceae bacterium]